MHCPPMTEAKTLWEYYIFYDAVRCVVHFVQQCKQKIMLDFYHSNSIYQKEKSIVLQLINAFIVICHNNNTDQFFLRAILLKANFYKKPVKKSLVYRVAGLIFFIFYCQTIKDAENQPRQPCKAIFVKNVCHHFLKWPIQKNL